MKRRVILASSSPRRAELLSKLGVAFEVLKAQVEETLLPGEKPEELVARLSQLKAGAVAPLASDALVLAADTIVMLDGKILGKPRNPEEAKTMLRALRGRYHTVFTGVAVLDVSRNLLLQEVERSEVLMRDYTDEEIEKFVASGKALDKAGAYAVQDRDFNPVVNIKGCYTSVMGLPICMVARLLEKAGLHPIHNPAKLCRDFTPEWFNCPRFRQA